MKNKKFEEEDLDENFNFIGWFGEDTEELEDYEEGNCEDLNGKKTDSDDEDWAYKYDYD
ncbi:MAG: hypothetical protein KKH52_03745 [Nanoarchaeota archaeon]|nr:hypothetical protein [Nanoarchaeota archaeon]MBU1622753.1 hypothetical protein [Nanoarchaeota archaeon]MBU1974481.1 hypothetical protein [Nanoarchaeota archaeon]